jgi:23S rRNA pseudouridine2605 synthase
MERLQKHLARAGVCSRRAAERLIEEGRVAVNGRTVTRPGSQVDPASDVVKVDGRRVRPASGAKLYLVLNKPRGTVTTMADPRGRPTIRHLLEGVPRRVFPVGRLDFHSEGLLLLTDDGDLAQKLMHPSSEVPKTYAVKVRGRPAAAALGRLTHGIVLDGRPAVASGVRLLEPAPNTWLELTVTEGRKHVVRRMLREIGHPVMKLKRVRYGGVRLGRLAPGQVRPLTSVELSRLRAACAGRSRARSGA